MRRTAPMETLSYIMPKLAWIIPLCFGVFILYVVLQNIKWAREDKYLNNHGMEAEGKIISSIPDKKQNLVNKLITHVTVEYLFNGTTKRAKRTLILPLYKMDEIKEGTIVQLKYHKNNSDKIYILNYENF